MPITKSPPTLCSASNPVVWNANDPSVSPVRKKIVVKVFVNGSNITGFEQSAFVAFFGALYVIDLQELCKDLLNSNLSEIPTTISQNYKANYFQTSPDQMIKVSIQVDYYEISGVAWLNTGTDVSGDVYVCAANIQQFDSIDLAPYNPDNAGAQILSYRTNSRLNELSGLLTEVDVNECGHFVSVIRNQNISGFQIRLYDNTNTVIGIATKFVPPVVDLYDVYTVGIAPQNLIGIAWDSTVLGFNPLNPLCVLLEIRFLQTTPPTTFAQRHLIKVSQKQCFKNGLKVFWQNQLGGFDSQIFERKHTNGLEVKSGLVKASVFYNPLEPNPLNSINPSARGKIRRSITAVPIIECTAPVFDNEYLGWVFASLQTATRVYISEFSIKEQITSYWQPRLVPVVVRDANFVYADNYSVPKTFNIVFELAHNVQILE